MNNGRLYNRSILVAIFERKGGWGYRTGLFDKLGLEDSERIRAVIAFEHSEEPVIVSVLGETTWSLITTLRVISVKGGQLCELRLSDIASVEPLQFGAIAKERINLLQIKAGNGESECLIETEPGPPFSGIWNVLAFVARKNRSSRGVTGK